MSLSAVEEKSMSPLPSHDAHSSTTMTVTHLPVASSSVPRALMHLPAAQEEDGVPVEGRQAADT
jgi:hypothetical protein